MGTELLMGEITDTNSGYIADKAPSLGITMLHISQERDDLGVLSRAIRRSLQRSDIVFTTGGLGPTQDDLTREAIADALEEEMTVDLNLLDNLKRWFDHRGIEMPPRNVKQATLIPSATSILNDQGTAPGWWVEKDGKLIISMPGPPGEMHNMWATQIEPRLRGRSKSEVIISRTIKTADLAEAAIAEEVSQYTKSHNPYLGIYAKQDGVHLRIVAHAPSVSEAKEMIRPVEAGLLQRMGSYVWGFDDDTPERAAGQALIKKGMTLATMESCTGGLLASNITDHPDSSAYFLGGVVTYTNETKILNGVSATIIEQYGEISEETADAMADAARQRFGADVGVGITGVAGPTEQDNKVVGTVFVAIRMNGKCKRVALHLPPRRTVIKSRSTTTALVELRRLITDV
ncbi:competence/damage-inducible protein A [SAR202 cluster bacterium AD-804-J14_MRT_500m]|nr:competence/damage-inducible protein A [SAR202 cluster bacterium AD-804-J14_MRT_500m]